MTVIDRIEYYTDSLKEAEALLNAAYRNNDMGYIVESPNKTYEVVILIKSKEE